MKQVKRILVLVFGLMGVVYVTVAGILGAVMESGDPDPDLPILIFVFTILGGAFLLAALIVSVVMSSSERRRQELLSYGIRVKATVIDITQNTAVRVNRRSPWRVTAECTHPITGLHTVLRSHNLWNCTIATGQKVEIVFDQMNERKYAFDIPEAEETA